MRSVVLKIFFKKFVKTVKNINKIATLTSTRIFHKFENRKFLPFLQQWSWLHFALKARLNCISFAKKGVKSWSNCSLQGSLFEVVSYPFFAELERARFLYIASFHQGIALGICSMELELMSWFRAEHLFDLLIIRQVALVLYHMPRHVPELHFSKSLIKAWKSHHQLVYIYGSHMIWD